MLRRPFVALVVTGALALGAAPTVAGAQPVTLAPRAVAAARPVLTAANIAAFDAYVQQMLGRRSQAVSVAVSRNGTLLYAKAYGVADRRRGIRATPAMRFRVGSISKTFTAIALEQLAEQGRLDLDRPFVPLLPARVVVPAAARTALASVTVRELMDHTSGLPVADALFFGARRPARSCEEAATRGIAMGLLSPPGTAYRYSNLNYCLAGLVLEGVTGAPVGTVVRRQVFAPLGITTPRQAGTYDVRAGEVRHPTKVGRSYMEALGAAGNWVATATDLVTVFDALDPSRPGPKLLSARSVEAMKAKPTGTTTTVAPPTTRATVPARPEWYGLGLRVFDQGLNWGHTGTVEGAKAMVLVRADGLTWAVELAGTYSPSAERLRTVMDTAVQLGGF